MSARRVSVASWLGERLTEMKKPSGRPMVVIQSLAWAAACSKASRPSFSIWPERSASGTNSSGVTMPRVGWVQRISASAPAI
ncbi:hypothetical protein D3C87_1718790 [compost metagenome]